MKRLSAEANGAATAVIVVPVATVATVIAARGASATEGDSKRPALDFVPAFLTGDRD